MKMLVKQGLHRFGYDLRRLPPAPASGEMPSMDDAFHEQRRLCRSIPSPVIFDVGAHQGQTAHEYRANFPTAQIFSFEPFSDSFARLKQSVAGYDEIIPLNIALAERSGIATLNVNRSSATNSLLATTPAAAEAWGQGLLETVARQQVRSAALDDLVDREIFADSIHILKLDVQGGELGILRGASRLLKAGRIHLVYLEVIVAQTYEGQGRLDELLGFAYGHGLSLHNIYNLCHSSEGRLNQFDALLVRNAAN